MSAIQDGALVTARPARYLEFRHRSYSSVRFRSDSRRKARNRQCFVPPSIPIFLSIAKVLNGNVLSSHADGLPRIRKSDRLSWFLGSLPWPPRRRLPKHYASTFLNWIPVQGSCVNAA